MPMAPKNHRVDAFLKRNLPPNEYETLRSFEPCVIVSEREKHVFRYIILSNNNLYLTENPPRNVQLLTKLSDVFSMEMVSTDERDVGLVVVVMIWHA